VKWLMLIGLPCAAVYALYQGLCGPMSAADVAHYVTIQQVVRGPHDSGRSVGKVVTIALANRHPRRDTPTGLWVACEMFGTTESSGVAIGTYQVLRVFRAGSVATPDHQGGEQYVPAHGTAELDFDTQSAPPLMNMRTGDALGNPPDCVIAGTQSQALALKGFRPDSQDRQGRMLTVTPLGTKLGLHQGW
jgi:hypothetical protein